MSKWRAEVLKRLKERDRSIAQMARAIYYEPKYIYEVLRMDDPPERVVHAINVYVGLEEMNR